MIKPDGLAGNYTSVIKKIILESGFSIPREMVAQLDEHSVKSFYAEHSSKSFFPSLVKYMTRYLALSWSQDAMLSFIQFSSNNSQLLEVLSTELL